MVYYTTTDPPHINCLVLERFHLLVQQSDILIRPALVSHAHELTTISDGYFCFLTQLRNSERDIFGNTAARHIVRVQLQHFILALSGATT